MKTIEYLEARLEQARKLRAESTEAVDGNSSFARSLSLGSLQAHIADLEHQLYSAKAKRDKELLEMRLSGELAAAGSVPLKLLAHVCENLSNALHASSTRLQTGRDPQRRIPSNIVKTLNLRLNGVAFGSSRLLITADTSPDLFGRSLTEETLESLFELLQAETSDSLGDAAHKIGGRGTRNVLELLKKLQKDGLEVSLQWRSARNEVRYWQGSHDSIRKLIDSLASLTVEEPEEVIIGGEVVLLSDSGRIDIKTNDDLVYRCRYPRSLMKVIQRLHIGQWIEVQLLRTVTYSEATGVANTNQDVLKILSSPKRG